AAAGFTAGSTKGAITLTSVQSTGILIGGANVAKAGLTAGLSSVTTTAGAGVSSLDISTQTGATSALATLDAAISQVGTERGMLGAFQNRLEHTVSNLMNVSENTAAAKSRINDADFATESANLAKAQVLQQAGTAMLAQANASTQNVLSLLK
ncbi:MAG: flagellin, partial [Gammaproteobacteria bacterium]|nr:flagellin [Gammaproteobacteria bacterium]